MPRAKEKARPSAAQQRAVMRSIDQQVAAELIGKPAVWLRDNAHLFSRGANGTYDAFEVSRAYVAWLEEEHEKQLGKLEERVAELTTDASDDQLKRAEMIARTRSYDAQAANAELRYRIDAAALVSRREIASTIQATVTAAQARIAEIPQKISQFLPQDIRTDITEIINSDIHKSLAALEEELMRCDISTGIDE